MGRGLVGVGWGFGRILEEQWISGRGLVGLVGSQGI